MDKKQVEFANKVREYGMSYETDLMFDSPIPGVYLCDVGVTFCSLEAGLKAVLDPPQTTSSLVAPSSPNTFRDNTTLNMTLSDPLFPLAQSTEYEIGDTLGISTSVGEDDACYESDNAFIEVYDLIRLL